MMRTFSIAILVTGLLASSAGAAGSSAALAAPGDCAQPDAEVVTSPAYEQAGGVAGPPVDHFAPNPGSNVLGVIPVRTGTLGSVASGPVNLVTGAADATSDAVDGATDAVGGPVGDALGDVGALGDSGASSLGDGAAGAIGGGADAVGSVGGGTLDGVTGGLGSITDAVGDATSGLGGL